MIRPFRGICCVLYAHTYKGIYQSVGEAARVNPISTASLGVSLNTPKPGQT